MCWIFYLNFGVPHLALMLSRSGYSSIQKIMLPSMVRKDVFNVVESVVKNHFVSKFHNFFPLVFQTIFSSIL